MRIQAHTLYVRVCMHAHLPAWRGPAARRGAALEAQAKLCGSPRAARSCPSPPQMLRRSSDAAAAGRPAAGASEPSQAPLQCGAPA